MKSILKPVLAAGLVLAAASPLAAIPASAQVVKGVGVVDPGVIVNSSAAFKTAASQRPTTFAQYYQQAKTREDQLNAQLDPMIKKYDTDRAAPNPNREDLSKQAAALNQLSQQGQREIAQILAPVALSEEYVNEQIGDILPKAIEAAAAKKQVSLILTRGSGAIIFRDQAYDMNQDIIRELDALLPVAQLVAPPGWLPRDMREQLAREQAASQAANGGAAPAAPAQPAATAGPPAESR
ncbi:OmpH family outer membrane protein [Erythrobacter sp. SG61-1L]|uniref:OmpH family outer membrane protein n=1 Tax=Erythrobacter sp. SG61-1L TaxID=1603897 RepID=UPI0006C901FD|nr:OmpH family outer membrane protein [Erythrobacter sp. SG61-1L]